jgi:uncharacterized membrane protein YhdT
MNISKVAQLVHQSWALGEPLEFAYVRKWSVFAISIINVEGLFTFSGLFERRVHRT